MIDKNGNRINPSTTQESADFILKEICFFEKAFKKNQNDRLALNITKAIRSYLKSADDSTPVMKSLEPLEEYAALADNEDFLWELVYIRRDMAEMIADFSNFAAAEHRHVAAKFFKEIVRVNPSLYNRCARVTELVSASIFFQKARNMFTTNDLLEQAKALFNEIEETNTEKYYSTGEYLYLNVILNGNIPKSAQAIIPYYLKMIYFSHERYRIEKNTYSIELMALAYTDCLSYEDFCYEDEKENIDELITLLTDAIKDGESSLEKKLKKLVDAVVKRLKT